MSARDVKYVTREQWGARPPKDPPNRVSRSRRTHMMVHYSTGQELGRKDTYEWVRQIQRYHQTKWDDIGYNFLIDIYGNVFEGRGIDVAGAHCPNWNTIAVGVCFLGNDDPNVSDLTPAARDAFQWLKERIEMWCGRPVAVNGHRDGRKTSCPGDELYHFAHHEIGKGIPQEQDDVVPPIKDSTSKPAEEKRYIGWAFPLPEGENFGNRRKHGHKFLFDNSGDAKGTPDHTWAGKKGTTHLKAFVDALCARGWNCGPGKTWLTKYGNDGVFGDEYEALVKKFQGEKGLKVDGWLGPKSWDTADQGPLK